MALRPGDFRQVEILKRSSSSKEDIVRGDKMRISKKQKIVACVIVVALAIACGWVVFMNSDRATISLEPPGEDPNEGTKAVNVGYGWSVKNGEAEAVEEAVSSVKDQLGNENPQLVILFSAGKYDPKSVLDEVRSRLPTAQIFGGASFMSVMTVDGLHTGENGSLALLAVSSQNFTFGVGGADMGEFSSPRDAGKAAVQAAINASGKDSPPKLVLMTAFPEAEEDILCGIEDVIGNDVPLIGGSSGNSYGQLIQFANEKVYSKGISLAVVYTDYKIGWAFDSGYLRTEHRGVVTKAAGRVLLEIDGQPAAELYNDWSGGFFDEEVEHGGDILVKSAFYPLAKVVSSGGIEYMVPIHLTSIDASDHSVNTSARAEVGDTVTLMKGDWSILVNRALNTPTHALESNDISDEDVVFGLYYYCAGALQAVPEDERDKIPSLVETAIGGAPFIGSFSYGEQGHIVGFGNCHGNLANSIVVFTIEPEQ